VHDDDDFCGKNSQTFKEKKNVEIDDTVNDSRKETKEIRRKWRKLEEDRK